MASTAFAAAATSSFFCLASAVPSSTTSWSESDGSAASIFSLSAGCKADDSMRMRNAVRWSILFLDGYVKDFGRFVHLTGDDCLARGNFTEPRKGLFHARKIVPKLRDRLDGMCREKVGGHELEHLRANGKLQRHVRGEVYPAQLHLRHVASFRGHARPLLVILDSRPHLRRIRAPGSDASRARDRVRDRDERVNHGSRRRLGPLAERRVAKKVLKTPVGRAHALDRARRLFYFRFWPDPHHFRVTIGHQEIVFFSVHKGWSIRSPSLRDGLLG